ncbi:hypothetical protein [Rhodococcus pyridinivorans]|uniref:hypothetical protein n=1 Tax=Rhodococcus pyridinivorans TaxID=103816 RepID=UPI00207911E6|nr:hypothetical protein [Rhodococcus pyridinivorans]USI92872.1 hypothetical protein LLA01_23360 [Rhodococcus pyridinivorans]
METAQERGFDRGIEVNGQRVTTLTERLDRLRGRWRELRAQENQLRTELHTWGIDPEAVPKQTVREVAAAQPAWREHPATERQLRTIERLAAEANVPFVLDDITKGQAHDLITAMLAGNLPNAQFTDRPAGPMFIPAATPAEPATPPAPAAAETSQDEEPQVEQPRPRPRIDPLADVERRVLERLAEPDTDADTAANPQVNTAAQFLSWADGHFTVKAQVALADLMADRDSLTDEQFLVCRVMLSDPKRWGELGHRAAEAYWQARTGEPTQHPVTTEVADAIVEARADVERPFTEDFLDTTQAVLDTQEPAEPATAEQRGEHVAAVQDGIDQAATVEVDQWWARGRAAYDPADPLTLPQPDTDPQVAAAIGKVRSRTGRDEIRHQWFAGVEQARREATAGERQALIAEVAVDPRLIAQVEGRRPDYLPAVTRSEVKSLIAEAARKAPPLRQAAAKVLLEHRLPDELYERAYAEWERVHGPELTWDQGTAAQWTAWMTMHARRDPLLGSWVGLPMYPRTPIIEIGIETAFEVMAEERPDLIAATADIPTERLAAEMRGNIIPNLPAPDPSELSAQFRDGAAYCALTLKDHPNSKVAYFPMRGWDYTLGGDSSSVTCGRNARAAIGALLEARNIALPEWIERAYRPYAQARATVLTRAIAYARNNEFYHAAASADLLWRYSQSGSAVADHALIKDVRRGIIDQLRSDFPAETALLDRYGIDLAWTLQHDVDPKVLRELRAAGDDLYSLTPADLTFAGAGDVVIGDPDGRHVTIRLGRTPGSKERITTVDGRPRPELTLRDAIAEARTVLAAEHDGEQLDPQNTAEIGPQAEADVDAGAEPQREEAEPPSPRVVAPAIDDAGAVIFDEVDPAPTEPSTPTVTDPALETSATSWVLTEHLMVGHARPITDPAPSRFWSRKNLPRPPRPLRRRPSSRRLPPRPMRRRPGPRLGTPTSWLFPRPSTASRCRVPCGGTSASWCVSVRNPAHTSGFPAPPPPSTPPQPAASYRPPRPRTSRPRPRWSRRPASRKARRPPNTVPTPRWPALPPQPRRCRTSPSEPRCSSPAGRRPGHGRTSPLCVWCAVSTSSSDRPPPTSRRCWRSGPAGERSRRSSTTGRRFATSGVPSTPSCWTCSGTRASLRHGRPP